MRCCWPTIWGVGTGGTRSGRQAVPRNAAEMGMGGSTAHGDTLSMM